MTNEKMVVNNDKLYDEILFHVGNDGKFQRNFNYLFNFFFIILATLASFNIVLAMAVPDHWCMVPGRETTNYTLEQWKTFSIPWTNSSLGEKEFNRCMMYEDQINKTTSECKFGWEYDQTWYIETIPSKQNWVCNDSLKVTNAFAFNRVGEIVGTLIFGQLGDRYGRKPTFFISLITLFIGRILTLFTTNIYPLFAFALLLGNLSSLAINQAPLIIGIEITKDEDRTFISLLQCISWTIGLCILPFVFWYIKHWMAYLLITTLPLIVFLFLNKFMVESPRWLASKGNTKRCIKELNKMAKKNNSFVSEQHISQLIKSQENSEEEENEGVGILSLFSTWTMLKVTLASMLGWACYMLSYTILYLNVTNLGGNPFLNFFWQGLAELPGYFLGKYLADTIGRKYLRLGAFLATSLGCVLIIFFIKDAKYAMVVSIISVFLKFSVSMAYYVISLQSLEIFPTSLRQTGTSVGTIVGYIFGLASPYVVYLGTSLDSRYPYLLIAALGIIAGLPGVLLPETLNQRLPETIEEVQDLCKNQNIWSLPKSYKKCNQEFVINK